MKIDPTKSKEIEAYLLDELNEEEKKEFESELAKNEELANEVQAHAIALGLIRIEGRTALKDRLNSRFNGHVIATKTKISPQRFFLLAVAASLAVLILVLGYNSWNSSKEMPELFAENFDLPILGQVRAGNSNLAQQNAYAALSKAYAQNDWEGAEKIILERLANTESSVLQQGEWTVALGGVYLADGKPLRAIEVLEKQDRNPYYDDQIKWYLGLGKLQAEDRAGAKLIFNQIAADSNHYREVAAKKILEGLD